MVLRLVLVAVCLTGCQETILLGSECPSQAGACPTEDAAELDGKVEPPEAALEAGNEDGSDGADAEPVDGGEKADSAVDAGAPGLDATSPMDAALPNDASSQLDAGDASVPEDAGEAMFPPFRNGSFDLVDGAVEGALTLAPRSTAIDPWYPCRGGMSVVSSAVTDSDVVVGPSDGDGGTFFVDSFPNPALNVTGLAQDLSEPLRAGQLYAFAVDLWSENALLTTSTVELELAGSIGACIPLGETLARSGPLVPGAWHTVCMSFIPAREVGSVMIMANASQDLSNWGVRLFVDNIRPATDCPP